MKERKQTYQGASQSDFTKNRAEQKTLHRFFGGRLEAQARFLNQMAAEGWRLVKTGQFSYTFEPCEPGTLQYCVEFVGQKSRNAAENYRTFLEDLGYRTFYKNINLNYTIGKVRLRPWANEGGQMATTATTYHRELLIVEKNADGQPFQLHTTYEDLAKYYRILRSPWLFFTVWMAVFGVVGMLLRLWGTAVFFPFAAASAIPAITYHRKMREMERAATLSESGGKRQS